MARNEEKAQGPYFFASIWRVSSILSNTINNQILWIRNDESVDSDEGGHGQTGPRVWMFYSFSGEMTNIQIPCLRIA